MNDDERELINQERGAIEELTVNLTPRSQAALRQAAEKTGDSLTDTINRAIQEYARGLQNTAQEIPVPRGFWRQVFWRLGWRR